MPLVDTIETFQMTNVGEHIDGTEVYQRNPNLLDNPWFTVNQRGVTTLSSGAIGIDRWYGENSNPTNNTMTAGNNGIAFVYASGYFGVNQKIEPSRFASFAGKVCTASVLKSDGTVISGSAIVSSSGTTQFTAQSTGVSVLLTGSDARFYLRPYETMTIRAVKLEVGSVSTILNDTPPEYSEELEKCKFYQECIAPMSNLTIGVGSGSASQIYIPIKLSPKYKTPTIALSANLLYGQSALGTRSNAIGLDSIDLKTGHAQIYINGTFTSGQFYRVGVEGGTYILFDSNL